MLGGRMLDHYLFDSGVAPFGNLRIKGCLAPPRSVSHAYCVLHRSFMPRHPPYTLSEIFNLLDNNQGTKHESKKHTLLNYSLRNN